ncbi:hypothetical protein [Streptomyces adustus]|uniref:hypothetical protein n=1 Tax=Streptomyces adustus TaxID=1609272 RepID=UPI003715BA27
MAHSAGSPARGAGSRRPSWGRLSPCADDDGSAADVSGDGGAVVTGSTDGSCVGVLPVGTGGAPVGEGTPGGTLCPGRTGADALALTPGPSDGESDGDADSPPFCPPCLPRSRPPCPAPSA